MKTKRPAQADDLRPEYNFDYSTAVRGKYYRRLIREGANVAVLEPDVAQVFRSSAAVNEALRSLLRISATTRRLTVNEALRSLLRISATTRRLTKPSARRAASSRR
jgi:Arc/MetJ family transcription regulator